MRQIYFDYAIVLFTIIKSTLGMKAPLLPSVYSFSGTSITVGERNIPSALIRAPNQLPMFVSNVTEIPILNDNCPDEIWENLITQSPPKLPYRVFDAYDRSGARKTRNESLPTIVLETDNLIATIYPTIGGKLASLVVKNNSDAEREILFNNPVLQPANLARLNAWTSGGVEWNWPRLGHTVFHIRPLFVAIVETERGPILRLYEFDRELNTTYSVDLFAPHKSNTLYAHIKLRNHNANKDVQGYWWTNIGVSISDESRVVYPASYAVISNSKGLTKVPFPMFSPWTNGTWGTLDHSYPHHYYLARENFIRGVGNWTKASRLPWMACIDGDGVGMVHGATIDGRKYWVWGNDVHDANRMNFLSSPGDGNYIEMQAGVAPTQSNTFLLGAGASREWTETFSPLQAEHAQTSTYDDAVNEVQSIFDHTVPDNVFHDVDNFLALHADDAPTSILWSGASWGHLHEQLIGEHLSSAIPFSSANITDISQPWYELIGPNGTFSQETLAKSPRSWMVDDSWVHILKQSMEMKGPTWLHYLHLAVVAQHHSDFNAAKELYNASLTLKPSTVAYRGLATIMVASDTNKALNWYEKAVNLAIQQWISNGSPPIAGSIVDDSATLLRNIVSETCNFLVSKSIWKSLALFIASIPAELDKEQAVDIAQISLLVFGEKHTQNPGEAISRLRDSHYAVTSPSTNALINIWYEAWYQFTEAKLKRPLTIVDKRNVRVENGPPACIDFRGAT